MRAGVVSPEQADAAAAVHRANERTIGQQLVVDGAVTELELAAALSYQLDVPLALFGSLAVDEVAVHLTPPDLARTHKLLVVGARDGEILAAMARPTDLRARDLLAERTGRRVVPLLALDSELASEIERRFPAVEEPDEPALAPAVHESDTPAAAAPAAAPAAPAARPRAGTPAPAPQPPAPAPAAEPRSIARPQLAPAPEREAEPTPARSAAPAAFPGARVDGPETQILRFVLAQAVRERAADIHIEPLADRLRIRFRLEGSLREVNQLPRDMASAVAARVRSLAGMGADEQQGRLLVRDESREATFDVSTVATLYGEKIVLRVLEQKSSAPDIEGLGMEAGTLERWREMLRSPYGLLLIAGMPGMGKTTSLFASVRELPSVTRDITTVEDPVALAIEGVSQVPVDRAAGATYASTLRAVLAQEPDIVVVGELRDGETAEVAMNAALAGRLVLSTIQAPDALAAAYRCIAIGANPHLVAASLVGILAQLLVPRLCEHCRIATTPAMIESALLRQAGLPSERVYAARGCARCGGTGFRGRVAVFELLMPNDEMRSAIEREAPLEEAREIAQRAGVVSLRTAGLRLVAEGLTTTQELMTRLPASG